MKALQSGCHVFCGVFLSACAVATWLAAEEPGPGPDSAKINAPSALDQQLLEELDAGNDPTGEKQTDVPPENFREKAGDDKPAAKSDGSPPLPGKRSLDDELLRDLADQENATAAQPADPLLDIGRRMRSVESRLSAKHLDDHTRQMQSKILADLTALLQECKQQGRGGKGKPGSKSGKPAQGSAGGSQPASQAPSDLARDSSNELKQRETESSAPGAGASQMRQSWGNLPERAREAIANSATDVFLPKYELLLEKYFRRLAEEGAKQP